MTYVKSPSELNSPRKEAERTINVLRGETLAHMLDNDLKSAWGAEVWHSKDLIITVVTDGVDVRYFIQQGINDPHDFFISSSPAQTVKHLAQLIAPKQQPVKRQPQAAAISDLSARLQRLDDWSAANV